MKTRFLPILTLLAVLVQSCASQLPAPSPTAPPLLTSTSQPPPTATQVQPQPTPTNVPTLAAEEPTPEMAWDETTADWEELSCGEFLLVNQSFCRIFCLAGFYFTDFRRGGPHAEYELRGINTLHDGCPKQQCLHKYILHENGQCRAQWHLVLARPVLGRGRIQRMVRTTVVYLCDVAIGNKLKSLASRQRKRPAKCLPKCPNDKLQLILGIVSKQGRLAPVPGF